MIDKLTFLSRSYILTSALPLLSLFISPKLFCEQSDIAISKIRDHLTYIKSAAKIFDINYKLIASVIFVERTLNYDWEDDALDIILAEAGINSSIGFCQVKLKTAYWIERQLNDSTSIFYPGKKYKDILSKSKSKEELITKLTNDSLNILYASAYLRIIQSRWSIAGYRIDIKTEIIGTLYSTGLFYNDGKERQPHTNPKANKFGRQTVNAYNQLDLK